MPEVGSSLGRRCGAEDALAFESSALRRLIVRKVNVNGFDGLVANQWAPQGVKFESSAFRQYVRP